MKIQDFFNKLFTWIPENNYNFEFSKEFTPQDITTTDENPSSDINIFPSIDKNLNYIKTKYNTLINSDIIIREFILSARNKQYKAFLFFIDGMVDSELINNFILKPLMLKNNSNSFDGDQDRVISETTTNSVTIRKVKKFDIIQYISNCLLPQNTVKNNNNFKEIFTGVNSRQLCPIYRYYKYCI